MVTLKTDNNVWKAVATGKGTEGNLEVIQPTKTRLTISLFIRKMANPQNVKLNTINTTVNSDMGLKSSAHTQDTTWH